MSDMQFLKFPGHAFGRDVTADTNHHDTYTRDCPVSPVTAEASGKDKQCMALRLPLDTSLCTAQL